MIVAGINNRSNSPYAYLNYDDTQRQRVTDAVGRVNTMIQTMAVEKGLPFVDTAGLTQQIVSTLVDGRYIYLCGEQIDAFGVGDEPHNGTLADNEHSGTVEEGLIANWYIEAMNTHFNTNIARFTDLELLTNAGITSHAACPTPTSGITPIPTISTYPSDANSDRHITASDVVIWADHYGLITSNGRPDGNFNTDVKVNSIDFGYVPPYWGQ